MQSSTPESAMSHAPGTSRAPWWILLAAALALSACGSAAPGGSQATTTTPDAATAGTPGAHPLDPDRALDLAYRGIAGAPPTPAVAPTRGRAVWIVSCGQAIARCAAPTQAGVDAATAIGWSAQVCDGRTEPNGWSACIRQGIGATPDAILVVGQDCSAVRAPLHEATLAGIPTVGVGGSDCEADGGRAGFTLATARMPGLTDAGWWNRIGALQADWVIGRTAGRARVLNLDFTATSAGRWIQDGFAAELARCAGCRIAATLKITEDDVAAGTLGSRVVAALGQDGRINAINVPVDEWFFGGLSQALRSSHRSDGLAVIGASGDPGNLDLIRSGGVQDATVAFSGAWLGWSGIDQLVRLFAKAPQQPAGLGLQVVDATRNLPAVAGEFSYQPAVDHAAAYQRIWGVR
jgi:ribose transport system substrate-binding protein